MKKILKYIGCALVAGFALVACSPDDFSGADGNLPLMSDYAAKVTVDQDNNVATFEIVNAEDGSPAVGVYPIWTVNGSSVEKSTVNGFKSKKIVVAGTYTYTMKVGNRNGISDGEISGEFTINTTRYDFAPVIEKLTGNSSKEWRVYSAKKGHLGCGENHDNPAGWWSAGPDEKASEGIYDDRVVLTKTSAVAGGAYSYSAGEDGNTFLNAGVTIFPGNPGSDWSYPIVGTNGAQTDVDFSLDYDGERDQVGIVLPAKTLFPYIANDVQFNGAQTWWITDMTDKVMTLALDLSGISWQVILINGEDEAVEEAFDPENINWCAVDAPENIGKGFNTAGVDAMSFFTAVNGWEKSDLDPTVSFADGVYSFTTRANTDGEWKSQCTIGNVPLNIEEGEFYDISCKLNASEKIDRITVKITKDPDVKDDPNSLFYNGTIALKKGDNIVRFAKIMAKNGEDPISFDQAKFILDLGGTSEGVTVKLSEIIVQKHNPK